MTVNLGSSVATCSNAWKAHALSKRARLEVTLREQHAPACRPDRLARLDNTTTTRRCDRNPRAPETRNEARVCTSPLINRTRLKFTMCFHFSLRHKAHAHRSMHNLRNVRTRQNLACRKRYRETSHITTSRRHAWSPLADLHAYPGTRGNMEEKWARACKHRAGTRQARTRGQENAAGHGANRAFKPRR